MSEDNQNPESPKTNTDLPKFELPKASAPTVNVPASAPKMASVSPSQRPAGYGASAASAEKPENPAFIIVDLLAAAVAVAFAVIMFLDK